MLYCCFPKHPLWFANRDVPGSKDQPQNRMYTAEPGFMPVQTIVCFCVRVYVCPSVCLFLCQCVFLHTLFPNINIHPCHLRYEYTHMHMHTDTKYIHTSA